MGGLTCDFNMASVICRSAALFARNSIRISAVRCYSDAHHPSVIDPQQGKSASETVKMPDSLSHSVGIERYEALMKLAGHEDPFETKIKKMTPGTLQEPTLVPSSCESRIIGCVCEEDAISINWLTLHKGEAKRCECGYWFKLVDRTTPVLDVPLQQHAH